MGVGRTAACSVPQSLDRDYGRWSFVIQTMVEQLPIRLPLNSGNCSRTSGIPQYCGFNHNGLPMRAVFDLTRSPEAQQFLPESLVTRKPCESSFPRDPERLNTSWRLNSFAVSGARQRCTKQTVSLFRNAPNVPLQIRFELDRLRRQDGIGLDRDLLKVGILDSGNCASQAITGQ